MPLVRTSLMEYFKGAVEEALSELDVKIDDLTDYIINQKTLSTLIQKGIVDASFAERKGALLVYTEDSDINISLYLHEEILRYLSLKNFCTLIEEISHFSHLVWFFEEGRQTTQLELELLGEIDKYLCLTFMTAEREKTTLLRKRLFSQFVPVDMLTTQQYQRYYYSYCLASKYCSYLGKKFLRKSRVNALFTEIRHFHQLSHTEKVSFIERC